MDATATREAERLSTILRELPETLTAARQMTDVVIAAGIAMNKLDGRDD